MFDLSITRTSPLWLLRRLTVTEASEGIHRHLPRAGSLYPYAHIDRCNSTTHWGVPMCQLQCAAIHLGPLQPFLNPLGTRQAEPPFYCTDIPTPLFSCYGTMGKRLYVSTSIFQQYLHLQRYLRTVRLGVLDTGDLCTHCVHAIEEICSTATSQEQAYR